MEGRIERVTVHVKGEEERDDGESEAKIRVFQIKCNFSSIGGGMES